MDPRKGPHHRPPRR